MTHRKIKIAGLVAVASVVGYLFVFFLTVEVVHVSYWVEPGEPYPGPQNLMFVSHESTYANRVGHSVFAPLIWICESVTDDDMRYWEDADDLQVNGKPVHSVLWAYLVR